MAAATVATVVAHSAVAHSAVAHSAVAHSAVAHSAKVHAAVAHSAVVHSVVVAHSVALLVGAREVLVVAAARAQESGGLVAVVVMARDTEAERASTKTVSATEGRLQTVEVTADVEVVVAQVATMVVFLVGGREVLVAAAAQARVSLD